MKTDLITITVTVREDYCVRGEVLDVTHDTLTDSEVALGLVSALHGLSEQIPDAVNAAVESLALVLAEGEVSEISSKLPQGSTNREEKARI